MSGRSRRASGGRLAVLLSHPIQYFAPTFREAATERDVDLTVFYLGRQGLDVTVDAQFGVAFRWDVPLLEGYRSVFLPDIGGVRGLLATLRRERYDAIVVHGWNRAVYWAAIAAAKSVGTRVYLRGDSNLLDPMPLPKRLAKRAVIGSLLRAVDGALFMGKANKAFFRHHGLRDDQLLYAPQAPDDAFYRRQAQEYAPRREECRARWRIPDHAVAIVAPAKLIPKKQPLLLLEAFAQVARNHDVFLLYAGDGALRPEVERRAAELGLADRVVVTGFLNQSEIGAAYTAADVMVLPSELEPWGIVVHEALYFGLPIVASDRVGSHADLVIPGVNGYVVPHDDVSALGGRLSELAADAAMRQRMGAASRSLLPAVSMSHSVEAHVRLAAGDGGMGHAA